MQRIRPALRPELMDDPGLPVAETERALRDLERVNRLLFGLGAAIRTLVPRLGSGPVRVRLLDLGTGGGQLPAAIARSAARRKVRLAVVGVDRKLSHLLSGRRPAVEQLRVVADAQALPFPEGSFDWSFSNLVFHHFGEDENRRILAEMLRVACKGSVVVDLRRSRLSYLLATVLLPLLGIGRVAIYDGRLSVKQAWTPKEVAELVNGLDVLELRRRFPFRFSLVLGPRPA